MIVLQLAHLINEHIQKPEFGPPSADSLEITGAVKRSKLSLNANGSLVLKNVTSVIKDN